jgi:hypothetical protein
MIRMFFVSSRSWFETFRSSTDFVFSLRIFVELKVFKNLKVYYLCDSRRRSWITILSKRSIASSTDYRENI